MADLDGCGGVVAATTGDVVIAEGVWDDVGVENVDDGVVGELGAGEPVLCTPWPPQADKTSVSSALPAATRLMTSL